MIYVNIRSRRGRARHGIREDNGIMWLRCWEGLCANKDREVGGHRSPGGGVGKSTEASGPWTVDEIQPRLAFKSVYL